MTRLDDGTGFETATSVSRVFLVVPSRANDGDAFSLGFETEHSGPLCRSLCDFGHHASVRNGVDPQNEIAFVSVHLPRGGANVMTCEFGVVAGFASVIDSLRLKKRSLN